MLKMRLQRRGKNNYATYRVVVAEHTFPVKGKYVADIGWYNPHTNEFKVSSEAAEKWLSQGAKPSATVHNLLVENGHLKAEKVTSWSKKSKPAEEETEKGSSAAESAAPKTQEKSPATETPAAQNPAEEKK